MCKLPCVLCFLHLVWQNHWNRALCKHQERVADPNHEGLNPLYLQGIHSIIHKNFSKLNLILYNPYMVLFVTNSSQWHIDETRAAKKESKALSIAVVWVHLLDLFLNPHCSLAMLMPGPCLWLSSWNWWFAYMKLVVLEIVPQKFWINNCSFRKHINSISCLFGLHSCYELAGIIFTCNLNKNTSLVVIDNSFLELLESWQNSQWKLEDKVHKKPWQF